MLRAARPRLQRDRGPEHPYIERQSVLLRYAITRILLAIPVALGVAILVFLVMRLLPGDPAVAVLGDQATPDAVAAFHHAAGLDQPLLVQFGNYVVGLFRGDLGTSFKSHQPVLGLYVQAMPYTIDLVLGATIIGVILGVPFGVVAAVRHRSRFDIGVTIGTSALISTAPFVLGIVLLLIFSIAWKLLPAVGSGNMNDPVDRLRHLVLPASSIGLYLATRVARLARTSTLEVLGSQYVRTARAKGLSEFRVIGIHALRNSLIPIVTLVGLYVAVTAAGSIVAETVFSRPGVGRVLIGAITQRDYPVVQSGILLYVILIVIVNVVVDLIVMAIDPRVRAARGGVR